MMKPSTCGVHSTDFMIQLCAISMTIDYIGSVVIIGFRNYHIGATLISIG